MDLFFWKGHMYVTVVIFPEILTWLYLHQPHAKGQPKTEVCFCKAQHSSGPYIRQWTSVHL